MGMAVSDIRTNQRKYFYTLPGAGNSCLWSKQCAHRMYAACDDGSISIMDIRRNRQSLGTISMKSSVQNIQYAQDQLLILTKADIFVLSKNELQSLNCKPVKPWICVQNKNDQLETMNSIDYDQQTDAVLVS